jgi:hypothetical protein
MQSLEDLIVAASRVTDLSPLSALRLKSLSFDGLRGERPPTHSADAARGNESQNTRVADLTPLIGMPIKSIDLTGVPVIDFSPLAQLPLERCFFNTTGLLTFRSARTSR